SLTVAYQIRAATVRERLYYIIHVRAQATTCQRLHYPSARDGLPTARGGIGETCGTDAALRRMGSLPVRRLHHRVSLLRIEGGPGDGSRHPDFHPRHWPRPRLPTA